MCIKNHFFTPHFCNYPAIQLRFAAVAAKSSLMAKRHMSGEIENRLQASLRRIFDLSGRMAE
jgi:hypothetical protein